MEDTGMESKGGPGSPDKDPAYFGYYAQFQHQANMLQDHARTAAYRNAILAGAQTHFAGRVVCDLGAGSGILSFFAAQAGAAQVYAIEASGMAERLRRLLAASADGPGRNSWLRPGQVTVIQGKVEEVPDIPQVDTLISEPIGVLLLHERMCESYLVARDRWLRPGGTMIPDAGSISLAPFSDPHLWAMTAEKAKFWGQTDFYGVDWTPLAEEAREEAFAQPIVGNFDPRLLMADPGTPYRVDFTTATLPALRSLDIPITWEMSYTGVMHGVAGWFDLSLGPGIVLSTSPTSERTHWQQIRFLFREPLAVNARERVHGVLEMRANAHRSYDLRLVVWVVVVVGTKADGQGEALCPARRREGRFALHEQTYWYDSSALALPPDGQVPRNREAFGLYEPDPGHASRGG